MKPWVKQVSAFMAAVFVLAAVGAIIYFVFLANSSVKGTVKVAKFDDSYKPKATEILTLKGKYFTLSYNSKFVNSNTRQQDTSAYEQYVFTSTGFEGKQLAVSVLKMPDGGLEENGDYKYRSVTSTYSPPREIKRSSGKAVVMARTDNREQTAFITGSGYIAEISLTNTGQEQDLTAEMNAMVASFHWVQ